MQPPSHFLGEDTKRRNYTRTQDEQTDMGKQRCLHCFAVQNWKHLLDVLECWKMLQAYITFLQLISMHQMAILSILDLISDASVHSSFFGSGEFFLEVEEILNTWVWSPFDSNYGHFGLRCTKWCKSLSGMKMAKRKCYSVWNWEITKLW